MTNATNDSWVKPTEQQEDLIRRKLNLPSHASVYVRPTNDENKKEIHFKTITYGYNPNQVYK